MDKIYYKALCLGLSLGLIHVIFDVHAGILIPLGFIGGLIMSRLDS